VTSTLVTDLAKLDDNDFERRWQKMSERTREAATLELKRLTLIKRYPTPIELAMALNPEIVSTPALQVASQLLVDYRDAVDVMIERRAVRRTLIKAGVDEKVATDRAAESVTSKGRTRIIFSMAPQEGKSTIVSRYGPLWLLMQYPTLRYILVSYDGDKASEFSYRVREDIEVHNGVSSDVDLLLRLKADQKAMSRWELTSGGSMYAIGIGGGLSGRPSDAMGIDDPTKDINAAESILQARNQVNWWETVARTRLAPWAPVMVTATRWAENDFPGQLVAARDRLRDSGVKNYDDWHVVNIPAKADYDPKKGESDVLGRKPGEFMLSARGRTDADWEQTEATTSIRFWNGLYQGQPTPGSGNTFQREWWRYYESVLWTQSLDGTYRVDGYDLTQSWDMAFKNKKDSDFVTCGVWAAKGADDFLIYQLRARLSFTQTVDAFRRITHLFPQAKRKLVEDKANGTAVMDSLKHEIGGIIAVQVKDSKESRADAITPFVRAGNVWLPSSEVVRASRDLVWDVEAFVDECSGFPFGANDDQVDQMTQYINDRRVKMSKSRFASAASIVKAPVAELTPMQARLAKRA
jgi:predicted phage terminase large subunit-like protein